MTAIAAGQTHTPSVRVASALIVFAACCFGSITLFAIVATRDGATLLALLTWRYVLAIVMLIPVAGGAIVAARNRRRSWPLIVFAGGAQAAIAYLSLAALEYMSAATLAFLFYTYPAWVAIFAFVSGAERVDARRLVALVISFIGIAMMVGTPWSDTTRVPLVGVLLSLSAAACYGLYIPAIGRMQQGVAPPVMSAYVSFGAGIVHTINGLATGSLTVQLAPAAWASIAGFAIIGTAVAFLLFLRGLAVLGPVRTAIVSTIEPFFTALLGALVLTQPLPPTALAGGALIAVAVILLQYQRGTRTGE